MFEMSSKVERNHESAILKVRKNWRRNENLSSKITKWAMFDSNKIITM